MHLLFHECHRFSQGGDDAVHRRDAAGHDLVTVAYKYGLRLEPGKDWAIDTLNMHSGPCKF